MPPSSTRRAPPVDPRTLVDRLEAEAAATRQEAIEAIEEVEAIEGLSHNGKDSELIQAPAFDWLAYRERQRGAAVARTEAAHAAAYEHLQARQRRAPGFPRHNW